MFDFWKPRTVDRIVDRNQCNYPKLCIWYRDSDLQKG